MKDTKWKGWDDFCKCKKSSRLGNEKLHVITHNYFGSKQSRVGFFIFLCQVRSDFSFKNVELNPHLQCAGLVLRSLECATTTCA